MSIVALSQNQKDICKNFASSVVSTNIDAYRRRNQTDVTKIIDDIYVGKLGEFAAYNFLKHGRRELAAPDVEIYGARKKSFAADLVTTTHKYHVKTMKRESAERYGLSWSFQIQDPLVKNPAINDVLALCEEINGEIDIKCFVRASRVCGLYTKPKLAKLHNIKVVLMWDDVEKVLTPL